jgi:hypothetical protein
MTINLNKKIPSIIFCLFLYCSNTFAQSEPYAFFYNTINYYAPANSFSNSTNKISYDKTKISIDLYKKEIILKTYYSDGPIESVYKIKKTSELKRDSRGYYYVFNCLASNYAEAIFEVDKEGKWIVRIITHNGIIHKYYNSYR